MFRVILTGKNREEFFYYIFPEMEVCILEILKYKNTEAHILLAFRGMA